MLKKIHTWRTVGFQSVALPGWRVLFLADVSGRIEEPLAGWLIEESVTLYDRSFELHPDTPEPGNRDRRVIAAVLGDMAEMEPVTSTDNFWCVLAPGHAEPTAAQESEERQSQARIKEYKARKRAEGTTS